MEIMKDGNLLEYFGDKCIIDPDNIFPEQNIFWVIIIVGATLIAIAYVTRCIVCHQHKTKNRERVKNDVRPIIDCPQIRPLKVVDSVS